MFKKVWMGFLSFIVLAAFTACGASLTGITSQNQSGSAAGSGIASGTAGGVQERLGIGILKLEDTPQAVTAEQAAALLPLWKAVKSLPTDSNTSALEMASLYDQIEETLTAEQVQVIEALPWTQQDINAAMQQYSPQKAQAEDAASGAGTDTGQANTSQPKGTDRGNGEMMAGGIPPGGGMPDGGEMMVVMDAQEDTGKQSDTVFKSSTTSSLNLNQVVAGTLVTLLKQRAA